jgi:hypothetical protein
VRGNLLRISSASEKLCNCENDAFTAIGRVLSCVMDAKTAPHLAALKESLLTLNDTGEDGFEGLLAAVLSEICEQPFRLASSGSQRGRDGDSAFDAGATYFEAKLYSGEVPRTAVASKLLELSIDDKGQVDTWILCATSPISSQHAELYRQSLERTGIGCLILDWPEHTLSSLAVLFVLAIDVTEQFLEAYSTDRSKLTGLRSHLEAVASDSQFSPISAGLRNVLQEPALGLGIAKAANQRWFDKTFSDRKRARQYFGQPLAPLDLAGLPYAERLTLSAQLNGGFAGVPDGTVFIVLGEEGAGKSWLVANGWLTSKPMSLLALFTADELTMPMALHDPEGVLIEKLADQTEGQLTVKTKARWQRRFKGWRANSNPSNIRLTVWVDGLNQASDFPWPRWIDAMAKLLAELGGRLIVTTNTEHFAQRIRGVVVSSVRRIIVGVWSSGELKAILASRGIDSNRLSADVFDFLRNPRILGIAVELLDANDIERVEELSVGRLLFEHIRRCERDGTTLVSAQEFAKALQEHADTVISRLESQQHDDLTLFDSRLNERLRAVSKSRFFASVGGDPDLYAIREDGLPLALGLSLLGSLRKEHRNGRDPAARLAVIVEPISAFAKTSEVIQAALLVACMEDGCPPAITAALVRYYVGIQNLPEEQQEAFETLAKHAPEGFMLAAHDASLFAGHLPNMQSLTQALLKMRGDAQIWRLVSSHIVRWLSYYSLALERRMFADPTRDPRDKVEAERAKRRTELDARLNALSPVEKTFVKKRLERRDHGVLSDLHSLAFSLLAGMPLSGFADALVNWSFSDALNSSFQSPNREFEHLIQFNIVDWRSTRHEVLQASELFNTDISSTGEWALVGILRATGQSEDATRAEEIAERLTRDREKFSGWSRVEEYCANDPCDPSSTSPHNIAATALSYEALDVSTLRKGMGTTSEDQFFADAKPGLARFRPDTAIAVQRKFARDVANREGLPRRQGMLSILPSSAILDGEIVDLLIHAAQSSVSDASRDDPEARDEWITAQYSLFVALPHKSGNEQLALLATLPARALLLQMLYAVVPANESVAEPYLECAQVANDVDTLLRVLSFIHYSRSPLSPRTRELLPQLLSSGDKVVRFETLAIISDLGDVNLLRHLAGSAWDARTLDPEKDHFEIWYGSRALIAAVEARVLTVTEGFDRMALGFYGAAVCALGPDAARIAAPRVDIALKKAAAFRATPELPLIERLASIDTEAEPTRLSLIDEPKPNDIRQFFERVNETDEEFQSRQKRAWLAFDRFSKELTEADARLVLDDISWRGLKAIVEAEPALARTWAATLAVADAATVGLLHYFTSGLAMAIADRDLEVAVRLFKRLSAEAPFVHRVFGPAALPAQAVALWSSANTAQIKRLCFERLDTAANDSEIAAETLTAIVADREALINEYVDSKLLAGEPSATARALMVAGFLDVNAQTTATLARFADHAGLVGRAWKAAQYAYERNDWARHWFALMSKTNRPDEFWQYSVLLAKIVDGRYSLWRRDRGTPSYVFERFFPTIEEKLVNRIKRWQDKRRRTLFGRPAPHPRFLASAIL